MRCKTRRRDYPSASIAAHLLCGPSPRTCTARRLKKMTAVGNLIVKAPPGAPIQNPYLPIVNRQALVMLKAASELGFTPAARPRIVVSGKPGDGSDPAEKYFN